MVHQQDNKRSLLKSLSCSTKVRGSSEPSPKDICVSTALWLLNIRDAEDLVVEEFECGRQDEKVIP